jgi:ATPase complex subunit ATP10
MPALRSTTRSFLDFYKFGNKKAIEDERARLNDEMNRGYFADMKEFKEHGGKIAAANKTIIPAASAIKFPVLAVTFSNGKSLKLPIAPNSNEVDTESLVVPKVSLVCLSFRASSQVQKILPRLCYTLISRMFEFIKDYRKCCFLRLLNNGCLTQWS